MKKMIFVVPRPFLATVCQIFSYVLILFEWRCIFQRPRLNDGMFRLAITMGLFLLCLIAHGQGRTVHGTILDEKGEAMVGVNIIIKGSTTGTVSDINGNYAIAIPHDSLTLVFSFVGYNSYETGTTNVSVLNVTMQQSLQVLSELVLVGYGMQEKKDVTGAISTLSSTEFNSTPTANLENNLQGRVAGVTVLSNGQPGSGAQVIIRGISSFAGSSAPLYVVDGVPTFDIGTINPGDVETISVLKDAGAASIYGSRAANGVILISTKKGKAGTLRLRYSAYYGLQMPGKGNNHLLDPQGMADLTWLAQRNSGITTPSHNLYGSGSTPVLPDYYFPAGKFEGDPGIGVYDASTNPITRTNKSGTNWYQEVTEIAPMQNHDVALSGGNDQSLFYVGFNYFNQDGIVVHTGAKRYSMRVNTEFKIGDRIRIGENLTNSYRSSSQAGNVYPGNSTAILTTSIAPAILPVYDIAGNFSRYGSFGLPNPYAIQAQSKNNHAFDTRIFGNVYAEADLFPELTFRTLFGGSFAYTYGYEFSYPNRIAVSNSFAEYSRYTGDWNWNNTVTFQDNYAGHDLKILIGTETIKTGAGRGHFGRRYRYFSTDPDYLTLDNGDADVQLNGGYTTTPAALLSFFASVDYNFRSRYLVNLTVRRDGSSKFIDNRYGTFPAATLAWRLSEESFMRTFDFIDDLRLRAGYGLMGDQMNANPRNSYTTFGANRTSTYYDIGGTNSTAVPGFAINFYGYPAGQWQVNKTANVGVDFSFFKSSLNGSVDVYQKITDKLLYPAIAPAVMGTTDPPAAKNVGRMENKGIDLLVNYQTVIGNLKLQGDLTFTAYVNTIKHISNNVPYVDLRVPNLRPDQPHPIRNQPNEAISSFFGYQVIGLWQSEQEILEANAQANAEGESEYQPDAGPGRFRFADINGDSFISSDDRTVIGNPNPGFTMGFNVSGAYHNFDFAAFFYGVHGKDICNIIKMNTDFYLSFLSEGARSKELLYNSWTPERRDAALPMAETSSNFSNNTQITSYLIEDGSYLRLRNVQLGYTLPGSVVQKAGIFSARIYVQGVNLLTLTKYSGPDPEIGGSSSIFGVETGNYPMVRQYIVGLNLEF